MKKELPPNTLPERIEHDAIMLLLDWQMQTAPDSWERIHRWRAQHPDHERAWKQIESTQQQLFNLTGSQRQLVHKTLAGTQHTRRHLLKTLGLLGIGSTMNGIFSQAGLLDTTQDQHFTGIGEQLEIALPDDGMLILNSRSALKLRYTDTLTEIALLQGEIFIHSGSDSRRPMRVVTTQGKLIPIGTEFNVNQGPHHTEVAVITGEVILIPLLLSEPSLIKAGQVVQLFNETRLQRPLQAADTAWRQGMLLADNLPITEFIEQLSRYHPGVIRIDPALSHLKVSGSYPIVDTYKVLQSLSHSLPIRLKQRSRYWISLHTKI